LDADKRKGKGLDWQEHTTFKTLDRRDTKVEKQERMRRAHLWKSMEKQKNPRHDWIRKRTWARS